MSAATSSPVLKNSISRARLWAALLMGLMAAAKSPAIEPQPARAVQPVKRFTLAGHSDIVTAVAVSPDGKMIATAGKDLTVRLWDAATGKAIRQMDPHEQFVHGSKFWPKQPPKTISALAFTPDSKDLWAGHFYGDIPFWNANSGQLKWCSGSGFLGATRYHPHGDRLTTVGFALSWSNAPNGIVDEIREIDITEIDTVSGLATTFNQVPFTPRGNEILASATRYRGFISPDVKTVILIVRNVQIYDLTTRKKVGEWALFSPKTDDSLRCVGADLSPDGKRLITIDTTGMVCVWDVATRKQASNYQVAGTKFGEIAFSPDGQRLAVTVHATENKKTTVELWSLHTQKREMELPGAFREVNPLGFSPDGKILVTGDDGNRAAVWDVSGDPK